MEKDFLKAIVIHSDGKIRFVDESAEKLLGAENGTNLVGKQLIDFIHPDSRKSFKRKLKWVMDHRISSGYASQKILKVNGDETEVDIALNIPAETKNSDVHLSVRLPSAKEISQIKSSTKIDSHNTIDLAKADTSNLVSAFLENIEDMVYFQGMDGSLANLNDAATKITGYSREEINQNPDLWKEIIHPDDLAVAEEFFKSSQQDKATIEFEYRLKHKNGDWLWIQSRMVRAEDEQGNCIGYYCIDRDVTEKKNAGQALRESENKFRQLAEKSLMGVYLIQDNLFKYANPHFAKIFGYTPEEIINKLGPSDLAHADDFAGVIENINKRISGKIESIQHQFRGVKKNGEIIEVEVLGSRSEHNGCPSVIGTLTDITEQKRRQLVQQTVFEIGQFTNDAGHIEEFLEFTRLKLSVLFEINNFYLALYDSKAEAYNFPYFSDKFDQPSFFSQYEMRHSLTDYVRKTGKPLFADEQEQMRLRKSGEVNLVGTISPIWMGVPLKVRGEIFGVLVVQNYSNSGAYSKEDFLLLIHISEHIAAAIYHKHVDEALHGSEERFRTIIESARDAIFIKDLEGRYSLVNPSMEKLIKRSSAEIIGKTDYDLYDYAFAAQSEEADRKVLIGEEVVEMRTITHTGSTQYLHVEKVPMRNSEHEIIGICGIVRDETARRISEEALNESRQRLSVLMKNLPGMAYRCHFDGELKMVYVSDGSMKLSGFAPSYFLRAESNAHFDVIHQNDRDKVRETIMSAIHNNELYQIEYRINTAQGDTKWVWEQGRAVEYDNDLPVFVEGFLTDISEYKLTQAQLNKTYNLLIAAIEQLPAGVIIADAENVNIRMANSAAMKIRGPSKLPLINIHAALHPDRWRMHFPDGSICFPEELPLSRAIMFGETVSNMELIVKRESGEERWISASSVPVMDRNGEIVAGIVVFPDITERKQMEEELLRTNQQLRSDQKTLRDKNIALRELLGQIDREKEVIERHIQANIDNVVTPIVRALQQGPLTNTKEQLDVLSSCLEDIVSPFVSNLQHQFSKLTPRELEICNLIKKSHSSKEIASVLNISIETVHQQRKIIRRKLGLTNSLVNLTSYLNKCQ